MQPLAGTGILICPGGGYSRLVMVNEGYDWVDFFKSLGVTVAILKYSMPHDVLTRLALQVAKI